MGLDRVQINVARQSRQAVIGALCVDLASGHLNSSDKEAGACWQGP